MDLQTLKYLEERSSKGRNIVKRIENLEQTITQIKKANCLSIHYGSNTMHITKWNEKAYGYHAEVEAQMVNVFIEVTNKEIATLEQELAEL